MRTGALSRLTSGNPEVAMKKILAVLGLLWCVCRGTSVMAGTPLPEKEGPPHGIGAYTCKEILDQLVPAIERKDARTVNEIANAIRQWTVDYVFGIQLTRGIVVLEGMDQKSIDMMLLDGCLAHPDLK